jgi:hypothetical protein
LNETFSYINDTFGLRTKMNLNKVIYITVMKVDHLFIVPEVMKFIIIPFIYAKNFSNYINVIDKNLTMI